MTDLSAISTADLQAELARRVPPPWCRCGKWRTRMSSWDHDGYAERCGGCLLIVSRCRC